MSAPHLYTVHFSRACPHGIMLARESGGRPVKGSLQIMEYSEERAADAARSILDGWCVIDRIELASKERKAAAAVIEKIRADDLRELAKQLKINEIQSHTIDRWVPCPGHRDKTVRGLCMLCAMERVLNVLDRAHAACADPSRPRQHVGEMLYFAITVASEALGRLPGDAPIPDLNSEGR